MLEVKPGTILVYSDIGCAWAHLAVYRLHETRDRLDLSDDVVFDHRAFPLEVFNGRPTPKGILDAEVSSLRKLEPEAGWETWSVPDHEYPVTLLPALEAVQAAKDQSPTASEQLDRALRLALFHESRTISMRHEILEIAVSCPAVDAEALADAIDHGRARETVMDQKERAEGDDIQGSPHVFLADGTSAHNPGIEMSWEGEEGAKSPVVHEDRKEIYDELLLRAAGR